MSRPTVFTLSKPNQEKLIKIEQPGEYVVNLAAPGCSARIIGSWLVAAKQHEVRVTIHHQSAHTRAETVLKGAARDGGKVGFWGKIIIDPGCPDVQSFLTERVLLLDATSQAEAVPELEILSDDVKCSHAASVSSINAQQLYYLMSRGLSRSQAEELIVEGFLEIPS